MSEINKNISETNTSNQLPEDIKTTKEFNERLEYYNDYKNLGINPTLAAITWLPWAKMAWFVDDQKIKDLQEISKFAWNVKVLNRHEWDLNGIRWNWLNTYTLNNWKELNVKVFSNRPDVDSAINDLKNLFPNPQEKWKEIVSKIDNIRNEEKDNISGELKEAEKNLDSGY